VRNTFAGSPYGWPQDAVDGALMALVAAGHLTARHGSGPVTVAQLDQGKIGRTEFRVESATLTAQQKIKLRGLFQEAGVSCKASDDLGEKSSELLDALEHLAERAGGEMPLPQRPSVTHLADLRSLAGNERLLKMLEAHDTLKANAADWKKAGEMAEKRMPIWRTLERLACHGAGLDEFTEIESSVAGIRNDRLLLDKSDHVTPLAKKAAGALRTVVTASHKQYAETHAAQLKALEATEAWQKISTPDRQRILNEEGVFTVPAVAVGTDDELLRTLDATPLTSWRDKTDALAGRFANAATKAAKLLEPKTQRVHLTSGTLRTEDDVRAWITIKQDELILKLKEGPVVVQ
jgi:hypothetical protein